MAKIDTFNAPVPGESLTNAPGGAVWESPPQHTELAMLCEQIWDKLNTKKKLEQMVLLLRKGIAVTDLANSILMEAFASGICTPDLALQARNIVARQIAAIGQLAGVKNMKIKPRDIKHEQFLANFVDLLDQESTPEPKAKIPEFFKGIA